MKMKMDPLPRRMAVLIVAATCVLAVPMAIGVSFRLGADKLSLFGIISLGGWIPLLILAAAEGRVPRRETKVLEDGTVEILTWSQRFRRIRRQQIRSLKLVEQPSVGLAMLYVIITNEYESQESILLQRSSFMEMVANKSAENQRTVDHVRLDGEYIAKTLGVRIDSTSQAEPSPRFLVSVLHASPITLVLLIAYCLMHAVGAIWSPYSRFMLLALLIASPIILGVQLGEYWKRSCRSKTRLVVALVGLVVGGGSFGWSSSRWQAGVWEAVEHGETFGHVCSYGGMYVFLFGLSVMMGNAGLNRD